MQGAGNNNRKVGGGGAAGAAGGGAGEQGRSEANDNAGNAQRVQSKKLQG